MESLYEMCARHSIIPRSLAIASGQVRVNDLGAFSGFVAVQKGQYSGREVTLKVFERTDGRPKKIRVSRW